MYYYYQIVSIHPAHGPEASRLRRRARLLLTRLHLPDDALPGSLVISLRRCGKPSCHCANSDGHPFATLTFMAAGKKRVETIPVDWLDTIRPRVEAGRKFKNIAAELLTINAELLVLARQQRPRQARQSAQPPP